MIISEKKNLEIMYHIINFMNHVKSLSQGNKSSLHGFSGGQAMILKQPIGNFLFGLSL